MLRKYWTKRAQELRGRMWVSAEPGVMSLVPRSHCYSECSMSKDLPQQSLNSPNYRLW